MGLIGFVMLVFVIQIAVINFRLFRFRFTIVGFRLIFRLLFCSPPPRIIAGLWRVVERQKGIRRTLQLGIRVRFCSRCRVGQCQSYLTYV